MLWSVLPVVSYRLALAVWSVAQTHSVGNTDKDGNHDHKLPLRRRAVLEAACQHVACS